MDGGRTRIKQAELLSTMGAGVLGAGIGVMLLQPGPLAFALFVGGLGAHGWGMYAKRQAERNAMVASWETWLYRACWVVLALLGLMAAYALRFAG